MIEAVQAAFPWPPDRYLCGQVELDPEVAIAGQVILGAAPGCRLIISAGVCLGRNVVIQACRGDLVIEPGAVLGSGVLVVGQGRIGQNACIGADSTLIDPQLRVNQVIPPKSLLGDPSQASSRPELPAHPPPELPAELPADPAESAPVPAPPGSSDRPDPASPSPANGSPIHGQKQVQQLLDTLFPHRRSLNGVSPEDRP
jgi:carbon dioxide concentrating mechanism protein CcmN